VEGSCLRQGREAVHREPTEGRKVRTQARPRIALHVWSEADIDAEDEKQTSRDIQVRARKEAARPRVRVSHPEQSTRNCCGEQCGRQHVVAPAGCRDRECSTTFQERLARRARRQSVQARIVAEESGVAPAKGDGRHEHRMEKRPG
jgi:hypothetical protein